MGVYIKGMKKPKCCGACLLCLDDSRIANGYCMIFHRRVNMAELDKKCPLVEVKTPHGRLYEETKIIDFAKDMKISASDYATWWYGEDAVIEAEVE